MSARSGSADRAVRQWHYQVSWSSSAPITLAAVEVATGEVSEALRVRSAALEVVSLDQPLSNQEEGTIADVVGTADDRLDLVEQTATIEPVLKTLPERQRRALHMRFAEDMTQAEIALHLEISQMQVSRLLGQAIESLSAGCGVSRGGGQAGPRRRRQDDGCSRRGKSSASRPAPTTSWSTAGSCLRLGQEGDTPPVVVDPQCTPVSSNGKCRGFRADGDEGVDSPVASMLAAAVTDPQRDGNATVQSSSQGLWLSPRLPYESWKALGARLASRSEVTNWWLGDWLAFGQQCYGRLYQEATQTTGLDYQTLRNYAVVAGRFPLSRRFRHVVPAEHGGDKAAPAEQLTPS